MRTRIKMCGLTRPADVDTAVEAGADAIGFVMYPPSPRYVSVDQAATLAARLPPFVTPVALFVNATAALIAAAVEAMPALVLQFHGDEFPADCRHRGRPYIRAARLAPGFDLLAFAAGFAEAQAFLLDAHVEGYGGGGKVFDWSLIPAGLARPTILSGGLHSGNVGEAIRRVRPWAVDVSSGVESARGVKDAHAMRRFCAAVREADAAEHAAVDCGQKSEERL